MSSCQKRCCCAATTLRRAQHSARPAACARLRARGRLLTAAAQQLILWPSFNAVLAPTAHARSSAQPPARKEDKDVELSKKVLR